MLNRAMIHKIIANHAFTALKIKFYDQAPRRGGVWVLRLRCFARISTRFSVSALKSIGFAVFNIATVNGFWRYLGRFSGLYGRNVWFSDFRMKYLRRALSPQSVGV